MPPTRSLSTKSSESNGPAKVSTQRAKKPSKPRKIPKDLAKIMTFCHYGIKSEELFNGDATLTADALPSTPEPAIATENIPYDTPQCFLPLSPETPEYDMHDASSAPHPSLLYYPLHPQAPLSDLEQASQHRGGEVPIPSYDVLQNQFVQTADIPSMSNNLTQSYGQYANNQFNTLSSSSMAYNNQPYQNWFTDLNPQTPYVSNEFQPTLYNDGYGETSPAGPSHFAMMSNDGTLPVPFPTDDVRYNFYSQT